MHEFAEDFYGEQLKLVLLGKLRPMKNFPSFRKNVFLRLDLTFEENWQTIRFFRNLVR